MKTSIKAIVGCEESQEVTIALRKRNIEAYSCDILPCSGGHPEWHIQDDILKHINDGWDLMIAHPPCTYLCVSGIRWLHDPRFRDRERELQQGAEFFMNLYNSNIECIAIENPIGVMSSMFRKPDQIIQPYMFGEPASKATCLWLKNLPKLISVKKTKLEYVTTSSSKKWEKWFFKNSCISNKNERSKARSKTFHGIAEAMAEQWGSFLIGEHKYYLL